MFGNFVTGIGLLGPTAMLHELSDGLDVSIRQAGLLITFGALVLCICSPVMAWLTSRVERRKLLRFLGARVVLTPAAEADWMKQVAIKERIYPTDVAQLAMFLSADDSAKITGQNFIIDGGRT